MTRKPLFILISELILIALFLTLLNRIFMPKYVSENEDGHITEDFYREKDTDILFVGSSTVYSGISPPVIWEKQGFTSYDRSNASQTLWTSYYMIEDAVKSGNKPKLVVLDIGFVKYDDDFAEEPSNRKAIDGMRPSLTKLSCIEAAMGESERLIEYIFPVLRFHTRWKELRGEDFWYALFDAKHVSYNGFMIDYRQTEELPERSEGRYFKDEGEILPDKSVSYLKKTLTLCRDNQIQVLLIKMPSLSQNWSYGFDRQIEEIAAPYGVNYINFDEESDRIGIDYLLDSPDEGGHLNTPGAEKFSAYLADYIKEYFELPSHFDDDGLRAVWDEKIRIYEAAKAEWSKKN
ncbi:MAG: hypothetical protein K6G83_02480 [Lachnospiraceae bacterium]|nr:hypothetical protein [Lachnospiraceae bacterium]